MTDLTRQQIDDRVAGVTIASRFLETVAARPDEAALRFRPPGGSGKEAGGGSDSFAEWSWAEYARRVAALAGGLAARGVSRGDRVVLMMRNRPEFHLLDLATLFLGATPVSIYNSSSPDQVVYLTSHCDAVHAVVEDDDFLERFIKARADLPELKDIAIIDAGGSLPDGVLAYDELASGTPIDLAAAAASIEPSTLATVIYTSGTTGPPKGVMLSHYNAVWTVESMKYVMGEDESGKRMVSYLPMAHIAERMMSYYQHLILGTVVYPCADISLLGETMRAARPQIFLGVPRVWEKFYAGIQAAVAADAEKEIAFAHAMDVGRACAAAREDGKELPDDLAAGWKQVDELAFSPIRSMIGLDQCEIALTGAAPIPHEVFDFFRAIGVPLSEIYGLSECTGPMTWERFRVRSRTVGRAIPGSTVSLLDDGEVVSSGGNIFLGYLNDPERTAEVLDSDGRLHTGDIGTIDADGFLRIVDRKKELIITAGGKNISPANLEAALKSFPLIGQAYVIGDAKPFIAALLVLDPEVAPVWAAQRGIQAASVKELASDPEVLAEIQRCVDEANMGFNNAERVKKFTVLPDEWLADSEELTPTMKLKRRGVHDKYAMEIEKLYT